MTERATRSRSIKPAPEPAKTAKSSKPTKPAASVKQRSVSPIVTKPKAPKAKPQPRLLHAKNQLLGIADVSEDRQYVQFSVVKVSTVIALLVGLPISEQNQ